MNEDGSILILWLVMCAYVPMDWRCIERVPWIIVDRTKGSKKKVYAIPLGVLGRAPFSLFALLTRTVTRLLLFFIFFGVLPCTHFTHPLTHTCTTLRHALFGLIGR